MCVVAVFLQAVTAEVPHVLTIYAWPDVIELAQHSMLGNVNDDLQLHAAAAAAAGQIVGRMGI